MKRAVFLPMILLMIGTAHGDPSNLEGGVLIAHHPAGLQFSSGQDWCARYFQDFAIDSCSEQHNRIDLDGNEGQSSVWYVLAAWTENKQWCGTEFGFGEYDPDIHVFTEWGPCSPGANLEIPTDSWPGPNEGTAVTTTDIAWSGNLVPVYWFAGYAYYEGVIPLAADPATDFGGTGNCATPPESWFADAFGGMGILADGIYACPDGGSDGGGSGPPGGDDSAEEDQGGGGAEGDDPTTWYVCPHGTADYDSIQYAVDAAAEGDIIELCDDTFTGPSNRNIHFDGKVLTLRSRSDNPESCIIDCEGSAADTCHRGLVFDAADTLTVVRGIMVHDARGGYPVGM